MESELNVLDSEARGVLCCATALRLGGGLYILAADAGFEQLYYVMDGGIRSRVREYLGGPRQEVMVHDALGAFREISKRKFPSGSGEAFFNAGIQVFGMSLEGVLNAPTPDLVDQVFHQALASASLLQKVAGQELELYERDCQDESVSAVSENYNQVIKSAGSSALRYRKVATSITTASR